MTADRDFPFKELSYSVIDSLYSVYNQLGFGHYEKVYQKAVAQELKFKEIKFKRENLSRVNYKGIPVGRYFYDFLIENQLVLEIKVGNNFYPNHLRQVLTYLRSAKLRLGIVSVFTPNGVMIKRIINPDLRLSA